MANRSIFPSIADISQDIAGEIPVKLIKEWNESKKTKAFHKEIIKNFVKTGTMLVSDSSGLTKITGTKPLIEVMKIISQPKEIIYSYGVAIGGNAYGIWAADNTQMFFSDEVPVQQVLDQVICAQKEINKLQVHVGIGLHHASFIEIGGGFFGDDADFIEDYTENNLSGGEIVITNSFNNKLGKKLHLKQRDDIFVVDYSSYASDGKKSSDIYYPIPFNQDFYSALRTSDSKDTLAAFQHYSKNKIVILVKVIHQKDPLLLNTLTKWVFSNTVLKKLIPIDGVTEVKSNGSLGIYVTDGIQEAVDFAEDSRDTLKDNGFDVNISISQGEILLFPMENGLTEVAGGPVNIASKLAEDSDEKDIIAIHNSVNLTSIKKLHPKPFNKLISGVELKGVFI